MLVLHGFWSMSGSLGLWAEDSDLLVKSPSQALRSTRPHPFAAPADAIAAIHPGKPGTCVLLLPSLRSAPLDSPELIRVIPRPAARTDATLLAWTVPVVQLDAGAALAAMVDAAVRAALPRIDLVPPRRGRVKRRSAVEDWLTALTGLDGRFDAESDELDALAQALRPWDDVGTGTVGPAKATFRLSEIETDDDQTSVDSSWRLEFLLASTEDPSLLVPAEQVWNDDGSLRRWLDRPQELLLTELGGASRIFPELAPALRTARPAELTLDADGAYRFLSGTAAVLDEAGFGVLLPSWWD